MSAVFRGLCEYRSRRNEGVGGDSIGGRFTPENRGTEEVDLERIETTGEPITAGEPVVPAVTGVVDFAGVCLRTDIPGPMPEDFGVADVTRAFGVAWLVRDTRKESKKGVMGGACAADGPLAELGEDAEV